MGGVRPPTFTTNWQPSKAPISFFSPGAARRAKGEGGEGNGARGGAERERGNGEGQSEEASRGKRWWGRRKAEAKGEVARPEKSSPTLSRWGFPPCWVLRKAVISFRTSRVNPSQKQIAEPNAPDLAAVLSYRGGILTFGKDKAAFQLLPLFPEPNLRTLNH
ncbi:hypothetical protein RUM43_000934 [Polyplax serrata]|uniref:Uncharacterized protein n=1 Tax=Polyplax serrata TaxID=468196 RepID=A0AAN8XR85_POLSC